MQAPTPPDRHDNTPAPATGWALLAESADRILSCRQRTTHLIAVTLTACVPLAMILAGLVAISYIGSWGGVFVGGGAASLVCRFLVRRKRRSEIPPTQLSD